jgi:hypothetical protein
MKDRRNVRSRREMLAGLGALGGSTLVGSPVTAAEGASGPTAFHGASISAERQPELPAPLTTGMRYVNIAGIQFQPGNSAFLYGSVGGELTPGSASFYTCHLAGIPNGARLAELVGYFVKNSANDIFFRIIRSEGSIGGNLFDAIVNVDTGAFGLSALPQTLIQPIANSSAAFIDPGSAAHFAIVNMPGVSSVKLNGIRVGYFSSQVNFVPLPPGRVYDSRLPVFGAAKFSNGQNVLVNVSHRRDLDGMVNLLDFVPPGATAINMNLSVTETVGAGFLAVTSGSAATFGAASLSWFGPNQIVTTGTTSPINAARLIRVWVGGTGDCQTHIIIDVTGYYI